MTHLTFPTNTAAYFTYDRCRVILFALAIFLLATYLYLVNASVFNIVARKQAEEKINTISATLAAREAYYLSLVARTITLENAELLGFVDASKSVHYLTRHPAIISLSALANEI